MRSATALILTVCLLAPAAAANTGEDIARLVAGLGIFGGLMSALSDDGGPELEIVDSGVTTFPDDGERHHVRHGEALYTKYNYRAIAKATTEERFSLGPGTLIFEGSELYLMADGEWCQSGSHGRCFADEDRDGALDKPGRDLDSGKKVDIPYSTEILHIDVPSDGFRTELVYQGAGGGVLRLAYREFVDDMARPAFTQDLTYDLPADGSATTIAFQGLDVEVIEANNMGLRYVVQPGSSGRSDPGEGEARTLGR